MIVVGIDPGTTMSGLAIIEIDKGVTKIQSLDHLPNGDIISVLSLSNIDVLGIEWVQNYGRVVGEEVLRTAYMCGRVRQAYTGDEMYEITRPTIVKHFTGQSNAPKQNVRQALLDRFGGTMAKKKGGILYGVSNHSWDALAVCVFITEVEYGNDSKQWQEKNWNTSRF